MWALIMTIYISYPGHAVSSSTLDNFQSEQACRYAGAQQEVTLRTDLQLSTSKVYTFICVPK